MRTEPSGTSRGPATRSRRWRSRCWAATPRTTAANEPLREYPSHLIAGQTYTILVPNGLASDAAAPQAKGPSGPLDADDAVIQGAGRTLRYTAKAGDTVSKLAVALLGSDTPA